jgi:acyl carrier protein
MTTNQDLDERLRELAATVLGIDADLLTDSSSPETLGDWTSILHLSLIAAVEEEFSIRFSLSEINSSQRFGELRRIVAGHLGQHPQRG